MVILSFDPGTITGYAAVNKDGPKTELVATGSIKYKDELSYLKHIQAAYELFMPDVVAIEQPFAGKFAKIIIALAKKVACITIGVKLKFEDALVIEVPPPEWKKKLELKGNAKKEVIIERIKTLFGDEYSEHEADAIGIALSVN